MGSHSIIESRTCSSSIPGRCRCEYGFFNAFSRSFTATLIPMWSGALVRRMYSRMVGAKYPPAPATSFCWNGMFGASAHIVLLSDCFSNATVSTRS